MRIRNNRYRRSYEQYGAHFKKEWRVYLLIIAACFIGSMFLVSWIYQWLESMSGDIERLHVINPFFVIYYGLWKAGGFTFLLWLLMSFAACYYKFYIAMVDYEYDPRGFPISPRGTYGTNRIMGEDERDSFLEKTTIDKTDKNVVYKDESDGSTYVLKNPKSLGPHKFVCGASGSWKTSSVFIPDIMQMIRRGESCICTDPKGELRSKTYRMAKKHNYIVREFNMINPILSDGCDFMKLVETYGDARTFTEVIMMNTSGDAAHTEDFWAKGERAAICFGILYVKEADEYAGNRTFKNVFEFLKQDLDTLNAKADMLPEGSNAKNQWAIFQTTPDNSKGGVMTGVATRLQILNDPAIANATSRDEIDITLPGFRPCIYYVLVSDQDTSNNVITSIFFSFLFIKLVKKADQRLDQALPVAVNFELDEMPNVCKIPEFPKKLSTIRSRNMPCTICAQDVGQMQSLFPGTAWANVISNCDTQIMLGCNDSEITGPFWQKAYGTMTIIVETEKDSGDRFAPVNVHNERGVSTGDGKREVFTVGEICGLENKYALIRFRGHNVIKGLKFSYFEHPMFEEIEEENYFTHKPLWWKAITEEAQNAENLKEYEWFIEGIKELDELNQQLNEQWNMKEKKEREEKLAKEKKGERIVNGATEGNVDKVTELKTIFLKVKRKIKIFEASLHGMGAFKQAGNAGMDESMEDAAREFSKGQDEKTYDAAYMDQSDDTVLRTDDNTFGTQKTGRGEAGEEAPAEKLPQTKRAESAEPQKNVEKTAVQTQKAEETAGENKIQKRIHENFAETENKEEEEPVSARKKSFSDSVAGIVEKKELVRGNRKPIPWNDEVDTKEDDEEDSMADLELEQQQRVNVPWSFDNPLDDFEPDEDEFGEPQMEEPDFGEPYLEEPEIPEPEVGFDVPAEPDMNEQPAENDSLQTGEASTASVLNSLIQAQDKQIKKQERIDRMTTKKTGGL